MNDPIRFILAGNALFTVENTSTGFGPDCIKTIEGGGR